MVSEDPSRVIERHYGDLINIATLDNGGAPFSVTVDTRNRTFEVHLRANDSLLVPLTVYTDVFFLSNEFGHEADNRLVGAIFAHPVDNNRSALKYMYVCEVICTWTLPASDPLKHVFGKIGNSAVPYQLGFTRKHALMHFDMTGVRVMKRKMPSTPVPATSEEFEALLDKALLATSRNSTRPPNFQLLIDSIY